MAENLRLRHHITRVIRRFLEDEHGFMEVRARLPARAPFRLRLPVPATPASPVPCARPRLRCCLQDPRTACLQAYCCIRPMGSGLRAGAHHRSSGRGAAGPAPCLAQTRAAAGPGPCRLRRPSSRGQPLRALATTLCPLGAQRCLLTPALPTCLLYPGRGAAALATPPPPPPAP